MTYSVKNYQDLLCFQDFRLECKAVDVLSFAALVLWKHLQEVEWSKFLYKFDLDELLEAMILEFYEILGLNGVS